MRPIAVTPNRHSLARLSIAGFLMAMLLSTVAAAVEYNPARTRPKAETQATAQRVIVKFRQASRLSTQATTGGESANAAAADTARMSTLASRARITVHASRALGGNMHVMQVSPLTNNEPAAETLARLRADSDVEFAELDRRVYPHATSNDPAATGQWYLQGVQVSAINANGAWDTAKGGDGVVIAVIDTGVLFTHPDLKRASAGGKFLPGYDFVSADSGSIFTTANDGDGRDPDPADPGDWVESADNCTGTPDSGSSWHGTRVSGIIAALTNNSVGVAGVVWNGYILPVRVIGKCGGFNSDVLAGMRWAAGLSVPGVPDNPSPAQVLNISLGGEGDCDVASQSVVSEVVAAGALIVVSAGNEGGPVDSPANCTGAMGIVGLRHAGTKVGFSSLGLQIALGAPGGNCVNINGGPCLYSIDTTSNAGTTSPGAHTYTNQTDINVGTSFSSPIVSGIAGLMLAMNGNLKGPQLIKRMQSGAIRPFPTTSETANLPTCHVPVGSLDIQNTECVCTTSTCGAGMANANGAVNEALRPIAAISAPATVSPGANVNLRGSGSAAACGHTVSTYAWSVVSGTVTLTNENTDTATLQAPASGSAVIRLTVTDEAGKSDTADITVGSTTTSTTAPANAGTKACLTAITPPASVSIGATDASASETGADTGTFTISRTGSTTAALAVALSVSGEATSGSDYTQFATTVNIPAGQTNATVTVTPVDDSAVESAEAVVVTLQAAAGYELDTPSSASVTIADNDTTPPAAGGDGGSGGGGALDLLTLLVALNFAACAVLRRHAGRRQRAQRGDNTHFS